MLGDLTLYWVAVDESITLRQFRQDTMMIEFLNTKAKNNPERPKTLDM